MSIDCLYTVDIEAGRFNLIPEEASYPCTFLSPNLYEIRFQGAFKLGFEFIVILFSFLLSTSLIAGTLIGVASKTSHGQEGKPKAKGLADILVLYRACLSTSTVTSYVESAAGVAEGGRTGNSLGNWTYVLVALIFSPIFTIIPSFATAPILVTVGLFMVTAIAKVDFSDYQKPYLHF